MNLDRFRRCLEVFRRESTPEAERTQAAILIARMLTHEPSIDISVRSVDGVVTVRQVQLVEEQTPAWVPEVPEPPPVHEVELNDWFRRAAAPNPNEWQHSRIDVEAERARQRGFAGRQDDDDDLGRARQNLEDFLRGQRWSAPSVVPEQGPMGGYVSSPAPEAEQCVLCREWFTDGRRYMAHPCVASKRETRGGRFSWF